MSILLNDPGCNALGANTGRPGCALNPKNIVGALLIDKDKIFSGATDMASLAAFIAAVQTLTLNPVGTRAYPIFRFDAVEDKSEDATVKTLGYGSKKVTADGKYNFVFEMSLGGILHNNKLRKFNKDAGKKVIFFDSAGQVQAVKSGTDGSITGFSLDYVHTHKMKIDSGGENVASYKIEFMLSQPEEMNEDIAIFDLGSDPETVFKGILDVELYLISQSGGTVVIGVREEATKTNLYDAYATKLADLDLWTVTKAGAAVVPSSVTAIPATKGFSFVIPATPTGEHIWTLATPAALAAKSVGGAAVNDEGYEASAPLAVTLTA